MRSLFAATDLIVSYLKFQGHQFRLSAAFSLDAACTASFWSCSFLTPGESFPSNMMIPTQWSNVSLFHIYPINLSFPYYSFHTAKLFVFMEIPSTADFLPKHFTVHNFLPTIHLFWFKMYFIGNCFHTRITHGMEASQVTVTKELHKKLYFQQKLCVKLYPIKFPWAFKRRNSVVKVCSC